MNNAVLALFIFLPFVVGILLANVAERNDNIRVLQIVYLSILNIGLIGVGLLLILVGMVQPMARARQPDVAIEADWYGVAAVTIAGCVIALLMLLPKVRRAMARVFPINPDSVVHMTALSMTATVVGGNLAQMILTNSLLTSSAFSQVQDEALRATFVDILVFPLLTLSIAALISVGLFTRRTWDEVIERLGLTVPRPAHLALAVAVVLALIGLALGADRLWVAVDPAGYERVGGVSSELMKNFTGLPGAFAIGLTAGIGEELFFRGAYQQRFGIVMTSLLFASFHVQYFVSIATLLVFVIGLILGVLRQRTSLTICILVHFLYNFTTLLLSGA